MTCWASRNRLSSRTDRDSTCLLYTSPSSISACSSSRVFSLGFVMGGRSFLPVGIEKGQSISRLPFWVGIKFYCVLFYLTLIVLTLYLNGIFHHHYSIIVLIADCTALYPVSYTHLFPRIFCTRSKVCWSMIGSWVFSKIVHSSSGT